MKKIFLLFITIITSFALTACSESLEDHLFSYINDELHDYTFKSYNDWETGELVQLDTINNDVATAILMLKNYITIDFETLLTKSDSSIEEVTKTYEEMYIYDVYTAFNMILVYKILDLDLSDLEDYFNTLDIFDFVTSIWEEDESGNWYEVTDDNGEVVLVFDQYKALTAINCLNMLDVNSTLKLKLISEFDNIDNLSYIDADVAAMVIISLQGAASKDYLDYMTSCITSNGVKNFNGDYSCSSTAQVLMALMSQGTIYRNNAVVDYLLNFRTTNGFKEFIDDEERDLSYASPQGFLAIATAYLFEETSNKVLFY